MRSFAQARLHESPKYIPLVTMPSTEGTTSTTKWEKEVKQNIYPTLHICLQQRMQQMRQAHVYCTCCGCCNNRGAKSCTPAKANKDNPDLIFSPRLQLTYEITGAFTACLIPCPTTHSWQKAKSSSNYQGGGLSHYTQPLNKFIFLSPLCKMLLNP